jgi:uncharacterized membrane-anchored protein YhcB (DUF1043 family)
MIGSEGRELTPEEVQLHDEGTKQKGEAPESRLGTDRIEEAHTQADAGNSLESIAANLDKFDPEGAEVMRQRAAEVMGKVGEEYQLAQKKAREAARDILLDLSQTQLPQNIELASYVSQKTGSPASPESITALEEYLDRALGINPATLLVRGEYHDYIGSLINRVKEVDGQGRIRYLYDPTTYQQVKAKFEVKYSSRA